MSCDCKCSLFVPWVGLQCVIVVFSDHTHFLVCGLCLGFSDKVSCALSNVAIILLVDWLLYFFF